MDSSKVIIWVNNFGKKDFTTCLQHHSQTSRESLTINCVISLGGVYFLLWFYIFIDQNNINDYIKHCKTRTHTMMQKMAWMMFRLFKEFLSFFKSSIPSIIFQFNHHLNKHNHMLHQENEYNKHKIWLDIILYLFTLPILISPKCELF